MRHWILMTLLVIFPSPLAAQMVVTSARPDAVAVSVYRDPERAGGGIDLGNLRGFALISETRTIDLPAGDAIIRFEGVADGIISVSAIVTGLPGGTVEKNRDAALLSPASLVDGTLGNRVMLRRTDRATGAVREEAATVRSSAAGAVVLQTAAGLETLRCTGLSETLVYNGVPAGLSARPTLSVMTRSPEATRATVTLTYLATGFDWAAHYVAELSDDGRSVDLLAWLTVANSNGASFADASLNALAGQVNVDSNYAALGTPPEAEPLNLSCFATQSGRFGQPALPEPTPTAPMAIRLMLSDGDAPAGVILFSMKEYGAAAVAEMENLGDLKLYRVPMKVTVAANGQKQVALLVKENVPVQRMYQITVSPGTPDNSVTGHLLRIDNRMGKGLGEPLPSGEVAVFEQVAGERRYAGASALRDHAVGETVNLIVGESAQVRLVQGLVGEKDRVRQDWGTELTNANPYPVEVEVRFDWTPGEQADNTVLDRLPRKDGYSIWTVTVPANGTETLKYRIKGR